MKIRQHLKDGRRLFTERPNVVPGFSVRLVPTILLFSKMETLFLPLLVIMVCVIPVTSWGSFRAPRINVPRIPTPRIPTPRIPTPRVNIPTPRISARVNVPLPPLIPLPSVTESWNVPGLLEAHGSIDDKNIKGNFTIGKRSIGWNGKHYTVSLDQCYFNFYDLNNDGMVVKEEMITIFGENGNSEELFDALDITTGDDLIDEEEFNVMSERVIDGCQKITRK